MSRYKYSSYEEAKRAYMAKKEAYYSKSRGAKRGYLPWTAEEEELIFDRTYTDQQLAEMLERSVMAIQVRRSVILSRSRYAEGLSRVQE